MTMKDQIRFKRAQLALIAFRLEWQRLGFWARIWRAGEFRRRFNEIIIELRASDPRIIG
jgi:hypothetical protein